MLLLLHFIDSRKKLLQPTVFDYGERTRQINSTVQTPVKDEGWSQDEYLAHRL